MDRKIKNTVILLIILIAIVIAGSAFTFFYQDNKIEDKKQELKDLNVNAYDTEDLLKQLDSLNIKVADLDSILNERKFNIPMGLSQSEFYNFVINVSSRFSKKSYVNIEFRDVVEEENFQSYHYRLFGTATFNDLYRLIYAVEKSKGLKKVLSTGFNNFLEVDENGIPNYLVSYEIIVAVYFANNARFASAKFQENNLVPKRLHNIFYPLIRKEIPPNIDHLLDVQTAKLLAILPDGAFLSSAQDSTYLLNPGDKVYLGYITDIDYTKNEAQFILNKGGIIEKVTLGIE